MKTRGVFFIVKNPDSKQGTIYFGIYRVLGCFGGFNGLWFQGLPRRFFRSLYVAGRPVHTIWWVGSKLEILLSVPL